MSTATAAFDLFPTLPTEVRLKIWSLCLSTPRTVAISCTREVIIRGAPRSAKSWATDTPIPPLLHVNRESRYEALAVYSPYFETFHSRPIYLSLSQDTVKLADGVLPYIPRLTLLEIQKMIIETTDSAYFAFYNLEIIMNMKSLREFNIYTEKGVAIRGRDGDWYLHLLIGSLEEGIESEPGWDCPTIRIFDRQTGKELHLIEGGVRIPDEIDSEL